MHVTQGEDEKLSAIAYPAFPFDKRLAQAIAESEMLLASAYLKSLGGEPSETELIPYFERWGWKVEQNDL